MATPRSRRAVLAAGFGAVGAVALSGCTSGSDQPAPPTPSRPSADEVARRTVATTEQALLATTRLLSSNLPAGRVAVRRVADLAAAAHAAHVTAMLQGLPQPSASSGSGSGSASSGASTATGQATPGTPVPPTTTSLATAQAAAATAYQALLGPVTGPLARLIASVAASDAALASALRGAAG